MISNIVNEVKTAVATNLRNIRGIHLCRKIVVFESDDWGSIRMPSKKVFDKLLREGVPVDRCPFNRFDSLAGRDDLDALFSVLSAFRDHRGNHPVITANSVMANPDFERIKESGYNTYYYEPFKKTLERYPKLNRVFDMWEQGIDKKLFFPQFHGREHVNIVLWLNLLRSGHPAFISAFEHQMWGLGPNLVDSGYFNIQSSFDAASYLEIPLQKEILRKGLEMFKNTFGFESMSFIANNYIWSSELNETLFSAGVKYIQGMKYQLLPLFDHKTHVHVMHYTGDLNNLDQIYIRRNASFEPSMHNHSSDCVDRCVKEIAVSFMWKRPAVISLHRLNFVGQIDEENRKKSLVLFMELLRKILAYWPDVEFMTTVELGNFIHKNLKRQS
ncbi:MAG: hypothetical protein FJ264_16130 [Planctomycetes bacterium]|nr:hypothetical protein [Planctomycetota bacterium]